MMAESTNPSQAESVSTNKTVIVEVNENTLKNVAIPDIYNMLAERINPDFGILDKLLASDSLSRPEIEEIKNLSTSYKRNLRLLELVTKNEKLTELFNALKDTHQEHLVNYVTAKGEYSKEYGGAWPLMKKETSILNVNQEALVDLLDFTGNEIVIKLYSLKVLNRRQKDFICKKTDDYEKAEALLDFLYRSSLSDYSKTYSCLLDNNQLRVAKILFDGGALVRVHNTTGGETETDTAAENEIVEKIDSMLNNMSLEESSRFMERLHLKLFAARVGHSVNLYILCETLDELMHLSDLLSSGELQRGIEELFNQLITRSEKVTVFTTVSKESLEKFKKFLEVDYSQERFSSKDILKLYEHIKVEGVPTTEEEEEEEPMEVEQPYRTGQEVVVEKGHTVDESKAAAASMDTDILKLTEHKIDRPELKDEEIIPAIIRNDMDYFTEHIKPKLLINKLHALGIIRDERMRHLRSMSYDSEKNYEVLNIIRAASTDKYADFVRCLRETDQNLVADVAEKGGVVLKVKVTHEPTENPDETQKEIVQKLKQLQDKTVTKSEELWRFLSQLKRANIEIVSARWDKGVVMWFWCRSQTALDLIERMNRTEEFSMKGSEEAISGKPEFHKFTTLLNGLFTLLLSGKTPPTISSVFLDNPDKDVVCQKLSADFPEDEDTKVNAGERSVLSAAKLENKIYVLCQNPTSALVFEEGDLTEARVELPVEGINVPVDMALSNKSNCLYITESSKHRVWKITLSSPENKVEVWLDSGAGDPFTLSVTNDGNVLMVKRGSPPSLDIYDPDAKLLLPLNLPTPMLKPNHAVETSKGNLIVSYDSDVGVQAGICEITKAGQIISRFDTTFESINGVAENVNTLLARLGVKNLFGFKYLAIDDKDQVYACSDGTDGLICLDSRLKLEANIRKDELNCPLRVQYVRQENQLIVVDTQYPNLVFILKAK